MRKIIPAQEIGVLFYKGFSALAADKPIGY